MAEIKVTHRADGTIHLLKDCPHFCEGEITPSGERRIHIFNFDSPAQHDEIYATTTTLIERATQILGQACGRRARSVRQMRHRLDVRLARHYQAAKELAGMEIELANDQD